LLLVALLGVSTALITEVRDQVTTAPPEQPSNRSANDAPSRSAGLPLSGLTLLQDTPAELPDRTQDSGVLEATGPGRLLLEAGDRIRPAPTPIPEPGWLVAGPQTTLAGTGIACEACQLELGDRTTPLPPNTTLEPDPTSPKPPAPFEAGDRIRVTPGATLALPPITVQTDRAYPLAAGATVVLPGPDPEIPPADEAPTVTLPEGSTVRASANTTQTPDDFARALSDAPGTRETRQAQPLEAIHPTIEITNVPDTIEKGQPFPVRGVVTHNGTPLAGHPVTVFANATKDRPGFSIAPHDVSTEENGRFVAQATIPTDKPTRPYHIVVRADPQPNATPPAEEAWTDPVVAVNGTTTLTLDVPETVGVRVATPLQATLTDEFGAPVPDQRVVVRILDTNQRLEARTDEQGQALAVLDEGLPFEGEYSVRARFPGTDALDTARDTARFEAVDARIITPSTLVVTRGSNATIDGTVRVDGQPPEPLRVHASYANVTAQAATDENGSFELELPVPTSVDAGDHPVEVSADAVDATRRLVLSVSAPVTLSTDVRSVHPGGGTLALPITASDDRSDPVPGLELAARTENGPLERTFTDEGGQATVKVPLPNRGERVVNVTTPGTDTYAPASTSIELSALPLTVNGDIEVPVDETANATVQFRVGDGPLIGEPVRLTGSGFDARGLTDTTGTARLTVDATGLSRPDTYPVDARLPRYEIARTIPARAIDAPTLDITLLDAGEDGNPIRVQATVTGYAGPLGSIPVTARTDGAFTSTATAITHPNGTAILTLDRPSDAEGTVAITVQAERTDETATVRTTASTTVTPAGLPWAWLGLAGVIPIVAIGATIAYRRTQQTQPEPAPSPTQAPTTGPYLGVRIPPQGDDLPPVWHAGEPTALELRLVDEASDPVPNATVTVQGPPGKRRVTTNDRGYARVGLPAHEPGTHDYEVHHDGPNGHTQTHFTLRVVHYAEEIDREYRSLKDRAVELGLVGPDATPRELARALAGPGDRLAETFERADYSPAPVTREDYEAFMRAKEACRPDGN